jgi:hypothetical protein
VNEEKERGNGSEKSELEGGREGGRKGGREGGESTFSMER